MVMEGLQEDMGEGSMLCTNHPYKNNTPGGICAFCLQEKLGKLVSSSFPIAVFPSSSSSSSPSFRSEFGTVSTSTLSTNKDPSSSSNTHHANVVRNSMNSSRNSHINNNSNNEYQYHQYYSRRSRIMFLLSQKKKKKKDLSIMGTSSDHNSIVFKRSKSTTTPRRGLHFMDTENGDDLSPQKRGFWSFLYLPKHSTNRKPLRDISSNSIGASTIGSISQQRNNDSETPDHDPASFDRKVSRSRSVGCGSRSFSGDFFERISTGFGDCTLRRVESQREGKSKVAAVRGGAGGHDCIKERVKCGGIFSGFMITSSSSSSSSSSYWVSSSTEENNSNATGKVTSASSAGQLVHARSKSWGWAFASPMRAFSKPSGKRDSSNKNATPNLSAIPSLLAVRS